MGKIIKMKLLQLGKKQTDLIAELMKRGIDVSQSDMSRFLSAYWKSTPKSEMVIRETEKILNEWENEQNGQRNNIT